MRIAAFSPFSALSTRSAEAVKGHPALVRLELSGSPLLARVTRRSAEKLGLKQRMDLWIQTKAVALV
jgi:ABC-type molybdate transport system ATPase subunit